MGHASSLFEWVVLNRLSEVSSSHAGRVFNEQNATGRDIALRDARSDTSSCPQPARASERRTIGSRSRSAVCTNEVAPYSRILRSAARWVVLTLARYFPRATTSHDGRRAPIEFRGKTFIFSVLVLTI